MAGSWQMRTADQVASIYAALPGTAPSEPFPQYSTTMKSMLTPGMEVAGCHPTRWIHELIHNDFTVCDMFERAHKLKLERNYAWEHTHTLVINGNQSFETSPVRILSAICTDCQFHFLFKMAWDVELDNCLCDPCQAQWPLRDHHFPWHHLVWVGSAPESEIAELHTKYYPILAREYFGCFAPPCTFEITLEISEPRVPSRWAQLLSDHQLILHQLKMAREEDPERYQGATDDWAHQAPSSLNIYLKNLLDASPAQARSISKRNKRFAVIFGPRCFPIFQHLEFIERVAIRNGVDEGSFNPISLRAVPGPTAVGTYRAYIEDVQAEIQCLMRKAGQDTDEPVDCLPKLHTYLTCVAVPSTAVSYPSRMESYKMIGVLPGQSREIIVNAYKRQWDLLLSHRRDLVESLMAIANDVGDEAFSHYAATQSSVYDSQLQAKVTGTGDELVSEAFQYLGLRPPFNYNSDAVISAFRRKLVQDPAEASTSRTMLLLIARGSTNDVFQTALILEADERMTLDTARAVLGFITPDMTWQMIAECVRQKMAESKTEEECDTYFEALEAFAYHTNDYELTGVARQLRRSKALIRPTTHEHMSFQPSETPDITIPVGLLNIGNTCYLNSLLQYLFTVKPVRDIVLSYNDVKLKLDDESIRSRRIGGNKMQMDRGEAVVAQAFAKELAALFEDLQSSTQTAARPSQRLANAVLLSTHTLLTSSISSSIRAAPLPRPLPARPSPTAPMDHLEDVEMSNRSMTALAETAESESYASSKTMVDREDAQSERSYEKVDMSILEDKHDLDESEDEPLKRAKYVKAAGAAQSSHLQASVAHVQQQQQQAAPPLRIASGDVKDEDVMDEPVEAETVDQKVLNALEHQKRSSGTDQQDVEEVMGSIINRLQAAIRPSSIDEETGIQSEKIMETFFVTTVNYTKKFDTASYQHEVSFDRSITAFPAPHGTCSLYEALGRNFDQQTLEESNLSRYTAIRTLPPVLHVLIQRTQSMGSKNGNAVIIPETLYLDRYMDALHDSSVFRDRLEDWSTAERIADLKSLLTGLEPNPPYLDYLETQMEPSFDSDERLPVGKLEDSTIDPETWVFDGPQEENNQEAGNTEASMDDVPPQTDKRGPRSGDLRDTFAAVKTMLQQELTDHQEKLDRRMRNLKSIPYRLHAVICHQGYLMSGHYWVWICDFEDGVWRWYNDAVVREKADTAEVLRTLSGSGEPYYLCYVRDADKDDFVNIPKRKMPTPPPEVHDALEPDILPLTGADADADADGDGDVTLVDPDLTSHFASADEAPPPRSAI